MMSSLLKHDTLLSENDKLIAAKASTALESHINASHEVRILFADDEKTFDALSIPAPAIRLLNDILKEMANGNYVKLAPTNALLTTQEAADMLSVSRPFLIKLLDNGKIAFQRLGSHRRILASDLIAFKEKSDLAREEAFRLLTEEAQELDLGY